MALHTHKDTCFNDYGQIIYGQPSVNLRHVCHCGSGKLPGIMRPHGWCCGECYNDRKRCQGPA